VRESEGELERGGRDLLTGVRQEEIERDKEREREKEREKKTKTKPSFANPSTLSINVLALIFSPL